MPTASQSVTEEFLTDDVGFQEISLSPIDHPGAHDPKYRARRNFIARLAKQYRDDPRHVIPDVDYTPQETAIWRHVYDQLEATQRRRACSLYLESMRKCSLSSVGRGDIRICHSSSGGYRFGCDCRSGPAGGQNRSCGGIVI